MTTQLNQCPSPDVLRSILMTLQTLEMRFEDLTVRLAKIESSMVSSACSKASSSPLSCCSHHLSLMGDTETPAPAIKGLESLTDHPAASAYLACMSELRKRCSLSSYMALNQVAGEPSTAQATGELDRNVYEDEGAPADDGKDWYSVSIYSSRPLSRLGSDIPPTPPIPQKSAQRASMQSNPGAYSFVPDESIPTSAMPYEDSADSPIPSDYTSSTPRYSSASSRGKTWSSGSQHSASTGRTSISTEGASSVTNSKRRVSSSFRGMYINLRKTVPQASHFIKRSVSIQTSGNKDKGKGKAKAFEPEQDLVVAVDYMVPVTNLEEPDSKPGFSFLGRTARACRSVVHNVHSFLMLEGAFIPV